MGRGREITGEGMRGGDKTGERKGEGRGVREREEREKAG